MGGALNGTLFVCGSLVEGMVHYKKIQTFVVSIQRVLAKGSVYRLDVGYPVYSAEGDHWVCGQLMTFTGDPGETFYRLLDEFHGYSATDPSKSVFIKIDLDVLLPDRTMLRTFAYSIQPMHLPLNAVPIPGGKWEDDIKNQPPLTDLLTERQRTYIRKLGASSGRDIVPINIDLYRELMGKGLIIDKGRRLALTRLGQEVFRYLD